MKRRIQYNKFGLTENPIGYHVAMTMKDREYLGEVIACGYNEVRGSVVLTVKHFNGEMWPFQPVACMVEVIG